MSRFRKSDRHHVSSINTASLPDLIFTLLFFFMIVTNMRDEEPKMKLILPNATEISKLEKKNLILLIQVGMQDNTSTDNDRTFIQINQEFITLPEIARFIEQKRIALNPSDRNNLIAALKIDKNVKMGIITDIKQELRKSGILTITYIATENK